MKILVTGFEPFNGGTVNPSEQIAAGVFYIEAVVPFLSFFSYRSFCHNRYSFRYWTIGTDEMLFCV